MDAAGLIVDFNGEAARIFGLDRAGALGQSLGELIVPPELREGHRAGLRRFVETRKSTLMGSRIEIDAVRADGERFPVELTIALLQEEPPVFIAHLRDIQGRVNAERRLRATAAVSGALASAKTAAEAIDSTLRELGVTLGWLGLQFWRVADDGGPLELMATWTDPSAGAARSAWSAEAFIHGVGVPGRVWATGESQWVEEVGSQEWMPRREAFRATGVRTVLGFPVCVHGRVTAVIEALTRERLPRQPELLAVLAALGGQLGHLLEEMEARAETERARRDAEEASRMKDEFLSVASHELRTPLNAVIGWTHLLTEGRLDEAARAHALEAISRNASAQARLVNDLLDMSRIVAGRFHLELVQVDLRETVRAAIDVVAPAAQAKGIQLRMLPHVGEAVLVQADADRMQQVCWNVLSNAVKFTPRGGEVTVRVTFGPDVIRVHVRDTGVGIPQEFMPRIFQKFAQADQTVLRVYGGLGLGLSIAKHFMDLHGGTIEVSSGGIDKGTEVVLSLPARAGLEPTAPVPAVDAVSLAGVCVLVVDADADARGAVAAIVEAAGANTELAASSEEALGCLSRSRFDVLVCAMKMPGRDGAWLARELTSRPPLKSAGVRRLAIAASSSERDVQQALESGFDKVLDPALPPGHLVRVVADLAKLS